MVPRSRLKAVWYLVLLRQLCDGPLEILLNLNCRAYCPLICDASGTDFKADTLSTGLPKGPLGFLMCKVMMEGSI
jgi:hypothetical protein